MKIKTALVIILAIQGAQAAYTKGDTFGNFFFTAFGLFLLLFWLIDDEVPELKKKVDAQQARIDALMLEFCPNEMTDEQLEEFADHQHAIPPEELQAWLTTNRTHEECTYCKHQRTMPAPCKGHVSGPTHCPQFLP